MTFPPKRIAAVAATLIALTLTACTSTVSPADPSGVPAEPGWQQGIADALAGALESTGIPGGSVQLTRDGTEWATSLGTAEVNGDVAVTGENRFGYRSITKSFTVTALLMLVDEGLVFLDDPLAGYVPGVPNGEQITLRMLAGMRSGLVNYSATSMMADYLTDDPEREWTDDELLFAALTEPPNFAPGTAYEYSNTNTLLIGKVLEAVTGEDWADVVAERVIEPLDLRTVVYPGNDSFPIPTAQPYGIDGETIEALPKVKASAFSAAGGLFGTIGDLGGWAQALGTGEGLDPATAQLRIAEPSATDEDPASPLYDAYGLGIGIIEGWIGHTGAGLGYQSLVMYHPETGDSVAILLNGTGDDLDVPAGLFRTIIPLLE